MDNPDRAFAWNTSPVDAAATFLGKYQKAEWRHTSTFILSGSVAIGKQSIMEEFTANLKELDPIEWREEFYKFKKIPYL